VGKLEALPGVIDALPRAVEAGEVVPIRRTAWRPG
jgi:hypothetical protein